MRYTRSKNELALGLTTVSSLGGQTLNSYDLTRAPGGSSGGSGVAAAANFAAFTMGTDTSGSIRIPSSHNAIVGLRPSAGLSSRAGIISFGHTQDTGGPMARTVADIATVLDATAGDDPADPVTATSNGKVPRTCASSLNRDALKGARIAVLTEFFGAAPEDQEVASIGFPVGVELLGRPFAEPTLIGIAYSYEQATRHRRPPSSTPQLGQTKIVRAAVPVSSDTGVGSLRVEVTATGARSVPPSDVPFHVTARFSFNAHTRELGYDLSPSAAASDQIAGVYLHRRANRPNGGVTSSRSRSHHRFRAGSRFWSRKLPI